MKRRTTSTSLERPVASSEGEIQRTLPTWLSHWRSQRLGSGRRIAASSRWEASPCTGRPTSFTSHCKAQGASNRTRDVDWGLGLEHAIPLADEPHGDWEATRASLLTVGSIPTWGHSACETGCRAHRLAEGGSQGVTLAAPPQPVVGSAGDRISLRSSDCPTTRSDGTLPAEERRRGSASSSSGAGPRRRPSRCFDLSAPP